MKTITKYMNEGFFNNVGVNYNDIVIDWIASLDGIISQSNTEELLRKISKDQLKHIITIDDEGRISTPDNKRFQTELWVKIYPKDIDSMPDITYFGERLTLKLILCQFGKSDFSKLNKLKDKLPSEILSIVFSGCDISDMAFLKNVKHIEELRMYESSITSFKGMGGIKIDNINVDKMYNTDNGNAFSTLPKITNSIYINNCDDIENLTGIKYALTPTTSLTIYKCYNIKECELSAQVLKKISGDDSIFPIFDDPRTFPKKINTIEFDIVKDLQRLDKIREVIKNHYPPSVNIYCLRCIR